MNKFPELLGNYPDRTVYSFPTPYINRSHNIPMLTMRGKININKRTFILIYLPFRFSNLVKATKATLHKGSRESKEANKISYHCLFCGTDFTESTVELPSRGKPACTFEPCTRGHYSREVN